jgi:hypothetical protein
MAKDNLNNGSSLLMVLCFISALSLLALNLWRNASYYFQSALERVEYAKLMQSAQGLMNVAVQVGIENYTTIMKSSEQISIEIPYWFTSNSGVIFFTHQKNDLLVRIVLKNKQTLLCALRCNLIQEPENAFRVFGWTFDKQL